MLLAYLHVTDFKDEILVHHAAISLEQRHEKFGLERRLDDAAEV